MLSIVFRDSTGRSGFTVREVRGIRPPLLARLQRDERLGGGPRDGRQRMIAEVRQ